jgi:prepilin-type N-terminal cleavage/methylation domain-containing protein
MRHASRERAFTLIELLVVVAIIALLLTILLPSMQRAREQGKIAVCSSNLRQIGVAAHTYLSDRNDAIPFALPWGYTAGNFQYVGYSYITEFIWGGGMPDKKRGEYRETGSTTVDPTNGDIYVITPKDRPMNPYFAPEVSWDRERGYGLNQGNKRPADIPGWFKCPSDSSPFVPEANVVNVETDVGTPWSTWEYWGTSYASNWYWPYYYSQSGDPRYTQYAGAIGFGRAIGGYEPTWKGLGSEVMHGQVSGRWAAEFILFYENRLNYALEGAGPRGFNSRDAKNLRGWHKDTDYHVALFLDGHVNYKPYDTRYIDGPGWTIWPARPWIGQWKNYENR